MRFLADESCDFIVVKALRAAGHDVLIVSEIAPRAKDTRGDFPAISFFSPAANIQGSFQPVKAKRGEFDRMFCHRPTRSNPYKPYPWRLTRWNPGTTSRGFAVKLLTNPFFSAAFL